MSDSCWRKVTLISTCEVGTTCGLEGRGNISQNGWGVGVDDIVGGLDAVRACYIGRQGSRGAGDELCNGGKGQRTENILDVSKRLRNAIGITTVKVL